MNENPLEIDNPALSVFFDVILSTSMLVSGIWAFALDNILPGDDETRGLKDWIPSEEEKK